MNETAKEAHTQQVVSSSHYLPERRAGWGCLLMCGLLSTGCGPACMSGSAHGLISFHRTLLIGTYPTQALEPDQHLTDSLLFVAQAWDAPSTDLQDWVVARRECHLHSTANKQPT
jgi:hypothetical protein